MILPTLLSLSRIALTPVFVILFFQGGYELVLGIVIFSCAALTDMFDGYIARLYNTTTFWGAFLDPLADKVLVGTALFCLAIKKLIPCWLVLVILMRDVFITGLRLYARSRGLFLQTTWLAKCKTVIQFFAIYCAFCWIILHDFVQWSYADSILSYVTGIMYLMAFLSIYTGLDYIRAFMHAKDLRGT
jgi:CDP-diacylglycerol---glycerol-3-phosphate 3-phosphatidyltransferase